ncbi:hypothetical protein W97_01830 [Coniosporium apollinis CBS 100218]|uniref:Pescadillo homolog n=1 Tax=Coniosporium apollinis (strain CBS 100218) TaxID=1168221 RepID=R7YLX5_CONA1|nr:uncharacterized protein W97_01830 [Coniosporium apollinis CBS 100218]EON62606.1 hypothetical protein W97_01830 [Coniosporium apollinis CBS 100218]
MARIKKKGQAGQAKNFITRTQAVRKLQISLPDFRRLCIFKGIYPREPRNKKKAAKGSTPSTTFYYTRDIQYLLHEPLLRKFREHKALGKKISKALGRGEVKDAARLEKTQTPRMTLDHIIKERYPTFVDALRDLDDALSMLFLFANLPSTATVPPKTIALCQRLCLEFEHYLITTHALRKSFLSIKGIYYQATIQGQDILWLVPYKFVQRVTGDVDFRIMGTFVEFYTTLLGFVNFRLYNSIGLLYPPKFDAESDERGGELSAFTLEGRGLEEPQKAIEDVPMTNGTAEAPATSTTAQDLADKLATLPQPEDAEAAEAADPPAITPTPADDLTTEAIDTFEPTADDADILPQPLFNSSAEAASLFANTTVWLSRETPRQPLEFLLKAFGCKRVAWDPVLGDGSYTADESDPSITHQIVDRPPLSQSGVPAAAAQPEATEAEVADAPKSRTLPPGHRVPGRVYVQPQWVWDCVNQGRLLRPDLYAPGATLPPHLSPWVKAGKGVYDPAKPLEEQEEEDEAEAAAEDEDEVEGADEGAVDNEGEESEEEEAAPRRRTENPLLDRPEEVEAGEGMDVAAAETSDEEDEDEEEEEWGGLDDEPAAEDLDEAEAERLRHQRELEAEAAGVPLAAIANSSAPKSKAAEARQKADRRRKEQDEELERGMMMMSRKKRKLFEKMRYGNEKKEDEAKRLRAKRRKLEKGKGGGVA